MQEWKEKKNDLYELVNVLFKCGICKNPLQFQILSWTVATLFFWQHNLLIKLFGNLAWRKGVSALLFANFRYSSWNEQIFQEVCVLEYIFVYV